MLHTIPREQLSYQLDRWLDKVDQYIWPDEHQTDTECLCFYTFKPFPGDLTPSQTESWAELQCHTLSPFEAGDLHYYLSAQGLHLWITREKLAGLPETAVQTRLKDGDHLVSGEQYQYQQFWRNGIMTACVTLPAQENVPNQALSFSQPWAVKRRLDGYTRSPNAWMLVIGFVFLCALSWVGTGALTLYSQQKVALNTTESLNSSISDKLAKQAQIKEHQATRTLLYNWSLAPGHLPESFGKIAERINPLGHWEVKEVSWQDHQLVLELDTGNIDIATLVNDLETVSGLASINIRPQGSVGTFLLEAIFNE